MDQVKSKRPKLTNVAMEGQWAAAKKWAQRHRVGERLNVLARVVRRGGEGGGGVGVGEEGG